MNALRKPALQDDAFLRDVAACTWNDGNFRLWWLGQSGFLLGWNGRFVLLDPYLSDSLTKKYAGTDKPHVPLMERVVDPERLDFISLVVCSHAHTDHLDPDTLQPLVRNNPHMQLVIPVSAEQTLRARVDVPRLRVTTIDAEQTIVLGAFTITAIPSSHETIEHDATGACRYLGYLLRFGSWTVYHSGDTVRYAGLAERLRARHVDVALLPINGRSPERRVPGNLDAEEAAALAAEMQARLTIPCHYDMFAFNTADPEQFRDAAVRRDVNHCVLPCGACWDSGRLER